MQMSWSNGAVIWMAIAYSQHTNIQNWFSNGARGEWCSNEMRFNKQELATLATQPSNKFEKEGILYITERQDGFFRRAESKHLQPLSFYYKSPERRSHTFCLLFGKREKKNRLNWPINRVCVCSTHNVYMFNSIIIIHSLFRLALKCA